MGGIAAGLLAACGISPAPPSVGSPSPEVAGEREPLEPAPRAVTLVRTIERDPGSGEPLAGLNGVAFLPGGDWLVTHRTGDRVLRFSPAGVPVTVLCPKIAYTGSKPDPFKNGLHRPEGLAVGPGPRIYVADTIRNHRIVDLGADGSVGQVIGGDGNSTHGSGTDPGSFLWPHGVAVSPDGRCLVVTDTGNDRVQIFRSPQPGSAPHRLTAVVQSLGPEHGKFAAPAGVAVDADYRIWVADHGNDRVVVLDGDGAVRRVLDDAGTDPLGLYHPYAIAVSAGGDVAVSDYGHDRVVVLHPDGRFRFSLGGAGTGPGRFRGPTGLAFDDTGRRLAVVDAFNHRVQIFRLDAAGAGLRVPVTLSAAEAGREVGSRPAERPRRPSFPALSEARPLTADELARWLAVEIALDEAVFHCTADGKHGWWGRGYYDWRPPFCAWSRHPLYREVVWRVISYCTLHEITGQAFFRRRARQALDWLVSEQSEDGSYRWWAGETPSSEGIFYVNGLVGEALFAGYRRFGETSYRDALHRIGDWALGRPASPNVNYNSFITHPLALLYSPSRDDRYLDHAVRLNRESIPPDLDPRGALRDAHNRKTVYHAIVVRGLLRLLSVMPAEHEHRSEIERLARAMLDNLKERQVRDGAFIASPFGAEPSPEPLIAMPAAVFMAAADVPGFAVEPSRIHAAVAWLARQSPERDDAFVIRDYLGYRDGTAPDRPAFRQAFTRALLNHAPFLSSRSDP